MSAWVELVAGHAWRQCPYCDGHFLVDRFRDWFNICTTCRDRRARG